MFDTIDFQNVGIVIETDPPDPAPTANHPANSPAAGKIDSETAPKRRMRVVPVSSSDSESNGGDDTGVHDKSDVMSVGDSKDAQPPESNNGDNKSDKGDNDAQPPEYKEVSYLEPIVLYVHHPDEKKYAKVEIEPQYSAQMTTILIRSQLKLPQLCDKPLVLWTVKGQPLVLEHGKNITHCCETYGIQSKDHLYFDDFAGDARLRVVMKDIKKLLDQVLDDKTLSAIWDEARSLNHFLPELPLTLFTRPKYITGTKIADAIIDLLKSNGHKICKDHITASTLQNGTRKLFGEEISVFQDTLIDALGGGKVPQILLHVLPQESLPLINYNTADGLRTQLTAVRLRLHILYSRWVSRNAKTRDPIDTYQKLTKLETLMNVFNDARAKAVTWIAQEWGEEQKKIETSEKALEDCVRGYAYHAPDALGSVRFTKKIAMSMMDPEAQVANEEWGFVFEKDTGFERCRCCGTRLLKDPQQVCSECRASVHQDCIHEGKCLKCVFKEHTDVKNTGKFVLDLKLNDIDIPFFILSQKMFKKAITPKFYPDTEIVKDPEIAKHSVMTIDQEQALEVLVDDAKTEDANYAVSYHVGFTPNEEEVKILDRCWQAFQMYDNRLARSLTEVQMYRIFLITTAFGLFYVMTPQHGVTNQPLGLRKLNMDLSNSDEALAFVAATYGNVRRGDDIVANCMRLVSLDGTIRNLGYDVTDKILVTHVKNEGLVDEEHGNKEDSDFVSTDNNEDGRKRKRNPCWNGNFYDGESDEDNEDGDVADDSGLTLFIVEDDDKTCKTDAEWMPDKRHAGAHGASQGASYKHKINDQRGGDASRKSSNVVSSFQAAKTKKDRQQAQQVSRTDVRAAHVSSDSGSESD